MWLGREKYCFGCRKNIRVWQKQHRIVTQVTVVLLQKQLQPFFFFASICSEWLASVYVSEQLHFRLHNVCCLKGMISVLSRSRDCQTLQRSEFGKKRKGVLGIVVSYMFYFCWVTLLVRLSYFSSCYLRLVNLLECLHSLV